MSTTCRNCVDGLAHCHGTVIVHVGLPAECTDETCALSESEHTLRIDCDVIGCGCAEPVMGLRVAG
ncbi:hypothetical protein A5630_24355 [Mycolicibacterium mucogenicum]|uniref:Uncharacterized protein n=1 Tax=Mycolicibacterium mucogenicum TaxID=56689 RepID=A0A1A3GZ20_MYCMU|nr:hypothetical protein [Mycolicibacterium mucogenicum]OBJ40638.1 hypothetical protein A5630_24355 [Mycolicibacterium mucogenicum]